MAKPPLKVHPYKGVGMSHRDKIGTMTAAKRWAQKDANLRDWTWIRLVACRQRLSHLYFCFKAHTQLVFLFSVLFF